MSFSYQYMYLLRAYFKILLQLLEVSELQIMRCMKKFPLFNIILLYSYPISLRCLLITVSMLVQVVGFLLLNMYLHVAWCLQSIINSDSVSEASLSSMLSKRTTLLEQLEYFLHTPPGVQEDGNQGNQLASKVSFFLHSKSTLWPLERFEYPSWSSLIVGKMNLDWCSKNRPRQPPRLWWVTTPPKPKLAC